MLSNWSFNKKCIITFSLLFIFFCACKKDRLKGDKEVLVGTWRWDYSVRTNKPGNNWQSDYIDTITPLTEGDSYKMEFCKNGKIHFYKNDEPEPYEKKRLVFSKWEVNDDFTIKLDNDTKVRLEGSLYRNDFIGEKDTLVTWRYFPFKGGENCFQTYFDCSYNHYFVRE